LLIAVKSSFSLLVLKSVMFAFKKLAADVVNAIKSAAHLVLFLASNFGFVTFPSLHCL
jgi:hypothetical protein